MKNTIKFKKNNPLTNFDHNDSIYNACVGRNGCLGYSFINYARGYYLSADLLIKNVIAKK